MLNGECNDARADRGEMQRELNVHEAVRLAVLLAARHWWTLPRLLSHMHHEWQAQRGVKR